MTYQSKRDLMVNVVSASGSSVPGSSALIKNTRRRIQQKRTRNRSGGGGGGGGGGGSGGGLKNNESKPNNPVIESSNPFFIAVCSPESYKPASSVNHRMGGRRDESRAPVTRTRPNVFLRQPSRISSPSVSGSGNSSYPNQFIHNPRLQNERQRDSSSASVSVSDPVGRNATMTATNINDTVQFPSLSSASAASPASNTSKLNFKEMVLKNKNPDTSVVAAAVPVVSVSVPAAAYVPHNNNNNVRHRPLSSGNIFSSAFYGPPAEPVLNDNDNDNDNDYDNSATTVRSAGAISSVLVDSCDGKYDKLYK